MKRRNKAHPIMVACTEEDHDRYFEARTAKYVRVTLLKDSLFFQQNPCRKLPHFDRDEVQLGEDLGSGEFGRVFEITGFRNNQSNDEGHVDEIASRPSSSSWPTSSLIVPPGHQGGDETHTSSGSSGDSSSRAVPLVIQCSQYGYFVEMTSDLDSDTACELDNPMRSCGSSEDDVNPRDYLTQNVNRRGQARYAVKTIRADLNENKKLLATEDAARELKLLSALSHPNIINVRGIMGHIGRPADFGIILDRLSGTLVEKIDYWSSMRPPSVAKRHHWPSFRPRAKSNGQPTKECSDMFMERIMALYDTARAMTHLHEKRILFRDLKPNNVGITLRGVYVIFDFGLAKELRVTDLLESPDGYEATGLTGSIMYMAPEVATYKAYGFSADVFSFAMLLWEVIALREAFPDLSLDEHYERVIIGGKRPLTLEHLLPPSLEAMMEASWSEDPSNRPTFKSICCTLRDEIRTHHVDASFGDLSKRTEILRLQSAESLRRVEG